MSLSDTLIVFSWYPDAKAVIDRYIAMGWKYNATQAFLEEEQTEQRIYLREVQNMDDARKLAGRSFGTVWFNYRPKQLIPAEIVNYLSSLSRGDVYATV